jgi:ribosome maturation factor RimP
VLKDATEESFTVTVSKQVKPEGAKRKITVEEDVVLPYNEVKYTKYLIRFK